MSLLVRRMGLPLKWLCHVSFLPSQTMSFDCFPSTLMIFLQKKAHLPPSSRYGRRTRWPLSIPSPFSFDWNEFIDFSGTLKGKWPSLVVLVEIRTSPSFSTTQRVSLRFFSEHTNVFRLALERKANSNLEQR